MAVRSRFKATQHKGLAPKSYVSYDCHTTTPSQSSSSFIPHLVDFFTPVVIDVYKFLLNYIIKPDVQIDVCRSSKNGSYI